MFPAVNPAPQFCVYLELGAPHQVNSVFVFLASHQRDHRASVALGRCDKEGSEVQITGFQPCEVRSNVLFLGEGVMEAATKEGEGIWGWKTRD